MSQPWIVLGDITDHGGTVVTAAPTTDTHGRKAARMGDMVSCPKHKGLYPIVQGDTSLVIEGQPAAYHGCKTACGATLIGSQMFTTAEPAGAAGGAGAAFAAPAFAASIGAGMAAGYVDELMDGPTQRYRGRFQLLDDITRQPMAHHAARVRSTGGQYMQVTTDAEGFTPWVERDAGEALAFDLAETAAA